MAISTAIVRRLIGASNGSEDFTSSGFGTPDAILVILNNADTDGTTEANERVSIGAADGTRQWCMATFDEDAAAPTNSERQTFSTRVAVEMNGGFQAAFSAWITDGVRLTVSASAAVDRYVTVILFKSDDGVRADLVAGSTQDTLVHYTSMGFEAGLLITACVGTAVSGGLTVHNVLDFGFVHNDGAGTVTQRSIGRGSVDNTATPSVGAELKTDGAASQTLWSGVTWRGAFSGFDSAGFDFHSRDGNSSADEVGFLAFQLPTDSQGIWVGNFDSPNATGNADVTGPGFTPWFGMQCITSLQAVDTHSAANREGAVFSISAFNTTTAICNCVSIDDRGGLPGIECRSISDDQAVNVVDWNNATFYKATLDSFISTGWRLNYTTAHATTHRFFGLALEDKSGPAAPKVVPIQGGVRASWSPIDGATLYSVRHSTDESTWTTLPANRILHREITGLDYTVTNYVQYSSDGGVTWSQSGSAQPYIDLSSDVTTLWEPTFKGPAYNQGDQAAWEVDDFTVAILFETSRVPSETSETQGIWGLQVQANNAEAGCYGRLNTSDQPQFFVNRGNAWDILTDTGTTVAANTKTVLLFEKTGTTYRIVDEDNSVLATGTTVASPDYATSGTNRTSVAGIGDSSLSPFINQPLPGMVWHAAFISGTVTVAERAAIARLFKALKTQAPATRIDLMLDTADRDAGTLAPALATPTKVDAVLTSGLANADGGMRQVAVHKSGDDWQAWYGIVKSSDNSRRTARATSTDGVTWSSEAEQFNASPDYHHTSTRKIGGTFYEVIGKDANTLGMFVYTSADGITWALQKDFGALGGSSEGKDVIQRRDGRYQAYHHDSTGDLRTAHVWVNAEDDITAGWSDLDKCSGLIASASTDQYYTLRIEKISADLWLGVVPRYNSTAETIELALHVSRNEGLHWTEIGTGWVTRTGWEGTDYSIVWEGSFVKQSDTDWRLYVALLPELHGTLPNVGVMGYASFEHRRLGSISGTGTWTTNPILTSSSGKLLINADPGAGAITIDLLNASDDSAITGWEAADFDGISGSQFSHQCKWGDKDLPPCREVKIKFTLTNPAALYAYEVSSAGGNGGVPSSGSGAGFLTLVPGLP